MNKARTSLLVAAVTMAAQNGIVMAFGVLYLPLLREFGEGRGVVAAIQSGVVLLGGLGAPFAGGALDRWGPRRLFPSGAALAAAGLLLASQTATLPLLVLSYGVMAGAGLSALSSPPNMVVVAQWFPGRRGRAIALADLGTALGAFAVVPLTQLLVDAWGWRVALRVLAGLLVALVVPANALFQHVPLPAPGAAPAEPSGRPPLGTAARTATFWWLAALRFFTGVGFTLVNVHAVAAAVEAGIAPLRAAAALGSVSLVSLVGRLGVGWLTDRLGPACALSLSFGSGLVGVACLGLLAVTGEGAWLAAFVLFYGLAQGSGGIVATAAATAAFHGPAVGVITGWIAVASGPGEALGAWGGGALYDWTGGYRIALIVAGMALAGGITAIWLAQRQPPR
ncbi:MAG: MFS transporter [Candidatus Rokubacteria bacterium]|nr:MFS transporter [Candidatus Rokubacteria bacterium]